MNERALLVDIGGRPLFQVVHDGGSKKAVIFCHGFRGTSVGPSRSFVDIARKLAEKGITSVRFDQHNSGNSAGNFIDSSFQDWIETTKELVSSYLNQGCQVALFGQSMGASVVIDVAAQLTEIAAAVAWVPDPNVDEGTSHQDEEILEEGGQQIKGRFWNEAHNSHTAGKLKQVRCPMYIVQCSEDEYVDTANHKAIESNAQPQHMVEMMAGYRHSTWSYSQFEYVIGKSLDFLAQHFVE